MNPLPVTTFTVTGMFLQHAVIIVVYSLCRFLLGKHKAAIEFYHEAARLNEKDWVRERFLLCLKVSQGTCSAGQASSTPL